MKSLFFPILFCSCIEPMTIRCKEKSDSKLYYPPPDWEKKSCTLRFKWLEWKKKSNSIGRWIECIKWTKYFVHKVRFIRFSMFRKWKIPSVLQSDIDENGFFGIKSGDLHRMIHQLEISEFCIELWGKSFHHTFISTDSIGKLSFFIRQRKDKIFVFKKLRKSFKKRAKFFSRSFRVVIDADNGSIHKLSISRILFFVKEVPIQGLLSCNNYHNTLSRFFLVNTL